ncbi:MAG: hypothetical protein ABFD05_04600 [Anaerolineaceae bacterium]
MTDPMIARLENSPEPSIRYLLKASDGGLTVSSPEMIALKEEVRISPRIQTMLGGRNPDGRLPVHAYSKWKGAFWTLLQFVDLGYPSGDKALLPLREQCYDWLLDPLRLRKIPQLQGRWRRCALQEGGTVFSLVRLGLADERTEQLVELLLKWQWQDGGWNCDKKPEATHSSFHESLIPLRGMNAYARASGDPQAKAAAERTAEMFLEHRLYKHLDRDEVITPEFTELAFPPYWHYDFLTGLVAMQEVGALGDPRCSDALDLLESLRLTDSGFAAPRKYYTRAQSAKSGVSPVAWGTVSEMKSNEWLTARALGFCIRREEHM